MRILLQNVNSLQVQQPVQLQYMMATINKEEIDISLLTEANTNHKKQEEHDTIWTSAGTIWPFNSIQASNVNDKFPSVYQPGGTCTIIHGKYVSRIKAKHADVYGRWKWYELNRKGAKPLAIINAYMPCINSDPGQLTYQMQLYRIIPNISTPASVRNTCWNDLTSFVKDLIEAEYSVIIAMDANSNPNDPQSLVSRFRENVT